MDDTFTEDLEEGERHERELVARWPEDMRINQEGTPERGRKGDILFLKSGKKMEVKSELLTFSESENFFIERWSSRKLKTIGGLWKAEKDGCAFYCDFWPLERVAYIFRVPELMAFTKSYVGEKGLTLCPNKKHKRTWGYKVPRVDPLSRLPHWVADLRTGAITACNPSDWASLTAGE